MRFALIVIALGVADLVQATSTSMSGGCGDACIAQLNCRATGADARICHCRTSTVPAVLECLLDACASDEERYEADAAFGVYCGGF